MRPARLRLSPGVGRWVSRGGRCADGGGATVGPRAARRWPPKRCRIISHRRVDCNTGRRAPSAWLVERFAARPRRRARRDVIRSDPDRLRAATGRHPREVGPVGVEYQVRAARITDIDRLVALSAGELGATRGDGPLVAADLMRQLVYLPQASVVVAERSASVVGGAVLALRPSVRAGGFVGTDRPPGRRPATTTRTASPTPCSRKSSDRRATRAAPSSRRRRPDDPAERARWDGAGFQRVAVSLIERPVATASDRLARRPDLTATPASRAAPAARPITRPRSQSWARTSPSSWTWRTSSMRPRPPAWTSITSRCSSRPSPDAISCARTHTPGSTRTTRTSATSMTSCARHDYKVVSKDIRKYGDGKVKANLDIELVVDMMKTARNLDVAIVVSGDGDFAPAIRAVQEMGVRVEVISFRGNTSSDLIEVADQFTDITQLATRREGLVALRPAGRRRRRGPVDDRGPRQADRGHRRGRGRGTRPGSGSDRRRRARARRRERPSPTRVDPQPAGRGGARGGRHGHRQRRRPGRAAGREAVEGGDGPARGRGRHPRRRRDPRTDPTSRSTPTATSHGADAGAAAADADADVDERRAVSSSDRRSRPTAIDRSTPMTSTSTSTRSSRPRPGATAGGRHRPPRAGLAPDVRLGLGLADRARPGPTRRARRRSTWTTRTSRRSPST